MTLEKVRKLPDLFPNLPEPRIRRLSPSLIIKYGPRIGVAEAEAMYLVATQTTIPTPRLEAAYRYEGEDYIIISYEHGLSFPYWWDNAPEDQRENAIGQLKDYVSQLRKIKGSFIGGIDHTPCRDAIFDWDHPDRIQEYGPYADEQAFNEGIVQALDNRSPPIENPDPESSGYNIWWQLEKLARSFRNHEIVFTHGDLIGGNMIVREDGTVVLIDWGLSGF